jgi:azurin
MTKYLFSLALLLLSNAAFAVNCTIEIEANDAMKFNQQNLTIDSSCKKVSLTLKHTGKLPSNVMGHNWVMTKSSAMMDIANAGMTAGLNNNYLPLDDSRVLAATKVIGGGQSDTIEIDTSKLAKGGDYVFFCSFPGHWAIMKGKVTVI